MTNDKAANPRVTNGSARRALVARMKAKRPECWICKAFGRDARIDYSLHYLDPRAFSYDELKPVSKWREYGYPGAQACALDPSNGAATHRACNIWRGNRTVEEVLAIAKGKKQRRQAVSPCDIPQPFDDF